MAGGEDGGRRWRFRVTKLRVGDMYGWLGCMGGALGRVDGLGGMDGLAQPSQRPATCQRTGLTSLTHLIPRSQLRKWDILTPQ